MPKKVDLNMDKDNPYIKRTNLVFNIEDPTSMDAIAWEYLKPYVERYEGSKKIKQLLYAAATGLDWATGRSLESGQHQSVKPVTSTSYQRKESEEVEFSEQ